METKTALEISVLKVLKALEAANYCQSTISIFRRIYNRLLKKAAEMQIDTFCDELAECFVNDSANRKTGAYCHTRKCLHSSCIRKLRECEEKGYVGWKPCVESKIDKPTSAEFQDVHSKFIEHLKTELGASGKVKLADPDTTMELTGFPPGGVCPFALKQPLPVLIDRSMERFPVVYAAAGTPRSTVTELLQFALTHLRIAAGHHQHRLVPGDK